MKTMWTIYRADLSRAQLAHHDRRDLRACCYSLPVHVV